MKITLVGSCFIIFGIFVAVVVSRLNHILGVPLDNISYDNNHSFNDVIISDSSDYLIWFLQISDLHISLFHDRKRIEDLKYFCDVTVNAIQPIVVLATGDLTDAKESNTVGSRQIIDEWKIYHNILSECKALKKTKWLDVRGNHDNFDVPGVNSKQNLFRNYSATKESISYAVTVQGKGSAKYTFIAVDACPSQGLRRPFNFIGLLTESEVERLKKLVHDHADSSFIIWFGHYPTSCILSGVQHVRSIIGSDKRSLAYLCGHLHSLGGLVPNMYTRQKEGFLELELADWKDNRMFRIVAIDHGLFNFVDVKNREWPVLLVTNPKQPLLATDREPLSNIRTSTHIRTLAFSIDKIDKVEINLAGRGWLPCQHISGPLYVLEWDTSLFTKGVHVMEVRVSDIAGRVKYIQHAFSLDGMVPFQYNWLARFCLMTNMSAVSQFLLGLLLLFAVIPLCILRYISSFGTEQKGSLTLLQSGCELKFLDIWIRKFWIISNINHFFYPLVFYPIYIAVGPWCIGELINDHYGVLFMWGSFVNGTFLPGGFTYTHAFFQMVLFHFPLLFCIAHLGCKRLWGTRATRYLNVSEFFCLFILSMLLISQIYLAYYFWLAYGTMAVLLGPCRTGPIILTIYSCHACLSISPTKVKIAHLAKGVNRRL